MRKVEIRMDFKEKLKKYQEIVNEHLKEYINKEKCPEELLNQSVEYSLMAGGKRIRPTLMIATYKLFKEDYEKCFPFAVAMEMIHNFSLIHDDLPGIDNDDFLWMGLLSCVLIVVLQKVLSVFLLHHGKYRSWIDGSPVTIVKDGKLLVQNMKKEHYTIDDLIYQMRLEHIMDIEEIRLAILETNGTLSIFRVSQFDTIRLPVITSGTMVKESFSVLGIDEATISEAFAKEGIDPKAILYASYGQGLIYYFYKTDDKATELTRKQLELPVKNTVNGDK